MSAVKWNFFQCPSPRFGDRASVTLELVSRVKKALKSRRGFGIERIRFFLLETASFLFCLHSYQLSNNEKLG